MENNYIKTSSKKRLFNEELQICRAIAALLVLIDHSGAVALINTNSYLLSKILGCLGSFGVLVFFVISGYIMMETTNGKFGGLCYCGEFLVRRITRIAPIYYVGTLFAWIAIYYFHGLHLKLTEIIYSMLFIARWTNIEHPGFFPVLGVGWTINLEMFFYALFSISLLFRQRFGSILLLFNLFFLVFAGFILNKFYLHALQHNSVLFYTQDIIFQFAAGILIYIFSKKIKKIPISLFLMLLILIASMYTTYLLITHRAPYLQRPLSILSIILVTAAIFQKWNFNQKVKSVLIFLGDSSYSIYIFHTLVLLILNFLFSMIGFTDPLMRFILFTVTSLLVSLICYYLFEVPSRRFIEKPIRKKFKN